MNNQKIALITGGNRGIGYAIAKGLLEADFQVIIGSRSLEKGKQAAEKLNSRLGYGAMRLSGQPGNYGAYADWEGGEQLLRRAIKLGVNFIDTAEAYGAGFNEELIASALHPYQQDLVVATKGGINKSAPDSILADASPAFLRKGVEGSLKRLKLERIDLYQLHRPDPKVPFIESIVALKELRDEGKIRHLGLSNVSVEQ